MLKLFRVTVIVVIVAAVLPVGSGVAAADSPNVADVVQPKDRGEYSMEASIRGITLASVPSMNGSGTTREGYISATATLTITRKPDETIGPVGLLWLRADLGCQIKPPPSETLVYSPSFLSRIPGLDLGALAALLPIPGPAPGFTDVGIAPTLEQQGSIIGNVVPGKIEEVPLSEPSTLINANMEKDKPLVISVQDYHLVSSCAGPLSVRLHAKAMMRTAFFDDYLDVYSDILQL